MHEALSLSNLKNRQNSIKYYNKTSGKRLYGLLQLKHYGLVNFKATGILASMLQIFRLPALQAPKARHLRRHHWPFLNHLLEIGLPDQPLAHPVSKSV